MKLLLTLFLLSTITIIATYQKECKAECVNCGKKSFACSPFEDCENGLWCCASSLYSCCQICRVCDKDLVVHVDGLRLENFPEIVYISEQGTFPQLELQLCNLSSSADAASWELSVTYEGATYVLGKDTIPLGKHWIPIVRDDNIIGGDATLTIKTLEEIMVKRFEVRGSQPSPKTVRSYIGETIWFAQAIAMQENEYRQFDKTGMPDRSDDGGYGIFQLTNPPPTAVQKWNWKKNVDEGIRRIMGKLKEAENVMARRRKEAKDQMGKTVPVPDERVGNCLFSDTGAHNIKDAVALKRYNGAELGDYVVWDNNLGQWRFNRHNLAGQNYVELVCRYV